MTWAATLAAALAAVVLARPAFAGTCGGSDSGGWSDSSSDSDSASDDSSEADYSTTTIDTGCHETSDVVGHQTCGSFGDGWGRNTKAPPFVAELGVFSRRITPQFDGSSGLLAHDRGAFAYSVVPPAERDDSATAVGLSVRLGMALPHLHAGVEGELGGVTSDSAVGMTMIAGDGISMPRVTTDQALYVAGGAYVGLHGRIGRMTAAAEVGAGVRAIQLHVQSQYFDCVVSEYHYDGAAYVEPRLRASYWVNPWFTVGGYAGADVGAGRLTTLGVTAALHVRAFDGSW